MTPFVRDRRRRLWEVPSRTPTFVYVSIVPIRVQCLAPYKQICGRLFAWLATLAQQNSMYPSNT